jgi:hypothetical protein
MSNVECMKCCVLKETKEGRCCNGDGEDGRKEEEGGGVLL